MTDDIGETQEAQKISVKPNNKQTAVIYCKGGESLLKCSLVFTLKESDECRINIFDLLKKNRCVSPLGNF